jgi:hypothetical protein
MNFRELRNESQTTIYIYQIDNYKEQFNLPDHPERHRRNPYGRRRGIFGVATTAGVFATGLPGLNYNVSSAIASTLLRLPTVCFRFSTIEIIHLFIYHGRNIW